MPSSITFLPAPAPATAPATSPADQPSSDAAVSFDAVLTKNAPPSAKSPAQTSVTGSARASLAAEKTAKAEKAEKTAKTSKSEAEPADNSPPAPLSAEELAALLALIGAPVALQQPPPPSVPANFTITGAAQLPDASDIPSKSEATSTAPSVTTSQDRDVCLPGVSSAQKSDTKTAFILDAVSTGEKLTPRDLLKQGADTIDYCLTPSSDTVPEFAETPAATPAAFSHVSPARSVETPALLADAGIALPLETLVTPAKTPLAPATPRPTEAIVADQTKAAADNAIVNQPKNETTVTTAVTATAESSVRALAASQNPSSKTGAEKIAATPGSREFATAFGVKSSIDGPKNKFLNVDGKLLKKEPPVVGTSAANWGDSMNPDARSTPFATRLPDGALSSAGAASNVVFNVERSAETAAPKAASPVQAAQIVNEIQDIADALWAVERSSVEVRFNFSETERLSVKVEYRDGVVQTTFRTDSPALRDTIAREWQSQVAAASESRPYRVADPVFATPPADARGFSLGGDSSRQQRQAEQSAGNAPHTFATTSSRGPSSSSVAAAPATRFTRPDTALHLHTFA